MIHKLHLRYGPIVRIAPGERSFTDSNAFQGIYAPRSGDRYPLPKAPTIGLEVAQGHRHLASAPDEDYERMRRQIEAAFSDETVSSQEVNVGKHVDRFIDALDQAAMGPTDTDVGSAIYIGDRCAICD